MKILKIILWVIPRVKTEERVGRPYVYTDRVILCCFVVMVAKRPSVRGLHAFLTSTEDSQAVEVGRTIPFPKGIIPSRRTLDRRLLGFQPILRLFMMSAVSVLVGCFRLGIARLTADNRMFEAVGGVWHSKDQKRGLVPKGARNIDRTAGWGFSKYRKWVFGHGLDIIVTTGAPVVPLMAVARSLKTRGNTSLKEVVSLLPKVKKGVIGADCEYEDQELAVKIKRTGRSLHTPPKRYPDKVPRSVTYRKRKTTVEPFFERFLQAFALRGKLDRKGPQVWPYLVTCCFLYQVMVIYNLMEKNPEPLKVTYLIRLL